MSDDKEEENLFYIWFSSIPSRGMMTFCAIDFISTLSYTPSVCLHIIIKNSAVISPVP